MNYDINQFNKFYYEKILPIMEYLEPVRQKKLHEYHFVKFLCIALVLLVFFVPTIAFSLMKPLGLTSGMGVLLGAIFFVIFVIPIIIIIPTVAFCTFRFYKLTAKENFKKIIKQNCLSTVLSQFENLKYKDQEIPKGLFEESGLFPSFDTLTRDDIYTGKYQDIWFHIEEVLLTSYRGIVIVFPMNKTVKSQTIISSKNDKNINNLQPYIIPTFVMIAGIIIFLSLSMVISGEFYGNIILYVILFTAGLIYLIFDTIRKSKKYESIKLEDIGFDKRFAVYSKDQIEARYLVTPTFMERLYKLQTAFGTKDIKCSFFGNKIMIAISTDKDLFEIGDLFTPLTDSQNLYQFVDELNSVYDLIDYFKLYEKTRL